LDLEKTQPSASGRSCAGSTQRISKAARFCFGPDVANQFARHHLGGIDREQFVRRALPDLRHNSRSRASLEIVLADGVLKKSSKVMKSLVCERAKVEKLVNAASTEMAERWPPGLIKRWPGYGIERFLRVPNDLTHILAG